MKLFDSRSRQFRSLLSLLLFLVQLLCIKAGASASDPPSAHHTDGQDPAEQGVYTRVIDTGDGLATVTRMPDGFYMVYDAGHWQAKSRIIAAVEQIVPKDEQIDLLVLSHGDTGHISAAPLILNRYRVRTVLRCGLERTTKTWAKLNQVLTDLEASGQTQVINLKHNPLPLGATLLYRRTLITYISGFYTPPEIWGITDRVSPEFRNAGSIVIRLTFQGRSILFAGDAIGRRPGGPPQELMATEGFMTDNQDAIRIDSDILIAPGHGADNAGSTPFIRAVSPEYVVFSAGHGLGLPAAAAVRRYLDQGVAPEKIFRTDLGDDEGPQEWDAGRITGHTDPIGDDDIEVFISADGTIRVSYARHE